MSWALKYSYKPEKKNGAASKERRYEVAVSLYTNAARGEGRRRTSSMNLFSRGENGPIAPAIGNASAFLIGTDRKRDRIL